MPLGANKAALFGVAGVSTGSAVLLSTATASNDTSIEFTLPTAYKQIVFGFYNITPATDTAGFQFQVNADGQTGYNETITSTYFYAIHDEANTTASLSYEGSLDLAQGTSYQPLASYLGNGADESLAGILHLFNPASTTYVKHFYSTRNYHSAHNYTVNGFTGGYINTTTNLSEISFKMSSGNISSGTIKMWGVT